VDEVVAYQQTVNGVTKRYYPNYNHLYSVAALTAHDKKPDGTVDVVERYTYNAYGKQSITDPGGSVARTRSAVGFDRTFTGYRLDRETGLAHANARYYSPSLGRFIGRDPWQRNYRMPSPVDGYQGSWSMYMAAFVPNQLDPAGTNPIDSPHSTYTAECSAGRIKRIGEEERWQSGSRVLCRRPVYCCSGETSIIGSPSCELVGYQEAYECDGPSTVNGSCYEIFMNTYKQMKQANWKNSDKYFHCMANCLCAKSGMGDAAKFWSDSRECFDQWIKGDSSQSSEEDQEANRYGRTCPKKPCSAGTCQEHCKKYRPNGLPGSY